MARVWPPRGRGARLALLLVFVSESTTFWNSPKYSHRIDPSEQEPDKVPAEDFPAVLFEMSKSTKPMRAGSLPDDPDPFEQAPKPTTRARQLMMAKGREPPDVIRVQPGLRC